MAEKFHSSQLLLRNSDLRSLSEDFDGANIRNINLKGDFYQKYSFNQDIEITENSRTPMYSYFIFNFLKCLKNLTVFRSSRLCDNSILQSLSENCPLLEEVYVDICFQVDNRGVFYLCGVVPQSVEDEEESIRLMNKSSISKAHCCRTLKKVVFEYTLVDKIGTAFLLKHCPNLEMLYVTPDVNMGDVFVHVHGSNTDKYSDIAKRYPMKTFHSHLIIDEQVFHLITVTCTLITDLTIRCNGTDRADKNILANLLNLPLERLFIMNCSMNSLIWFLEKKGKNLRSLTIQHLATAFPSLNMSRTHLQQVAIMCPNLVKFSLRLSGSASISPDVPYSYFGANMACFTTLTHLIIEGVNLWHEDLIVLISKCTNLKILYLICQNLEVVDDVFIYDLLANSQLNELEAMYLHRPLLTMAGLRRLIDCCPNLKSVGPLSSWAIPRKERDQLSQEIKSKNWNLNIDSPELITEFFL